MILIKGDVFEMGSNSGSDDEVPIHDVKVSDFLLSKYEVTQKEYKYLVGRNPSNNKDNLENPVEQVTWYDAIIYCNLRSQIEKLEPVYIIEKKNVIADWTKNGYRLPTEAEWEYSAKRGKNDMQYNLLDEYEWYTNNSSGKTHPVGQKKPNNYGIFDLDGNVSEWCWDEYKKYNSGLQINPQEKRYSTLSVYRGGCYISIIKYITPSKRFEKQCYYSSPYTGFRLARSIINEVKGI
jgi:formylglycine-generating enzyme required for sulfatase activity